MSDWPPNPLKTYLPDLPIQHVYPPPPPLSEFREFQRIRLKHINKILEECEKRPEEVVAVADND